MVERIDEFRSLWVKQLLDVDTVARHLNLSRHSVWYWSKELGLNVERKQAMKSKLKARWIEPGAKQKKRRLWEEDMGQNIFMPPNGGCEKCSLEQACRTYQTWTFDEGLPCEKLLQDEEIIIQNGGCVKSELGDMTPIRGVIRYDLLSG